MQFSFLFEMQLFEIPWGKILIPLLLLPASFPRWHKGIQNLKNPSSANIPSCFLYSWIAAVMTVRYGMRRVWKISYPALPSNTRSFTCAWREEPGNLAEEVNTSGLFWLSCKIWKCITLLQNLCIVTTNFLKFYFLKLYYFLKLSIDFY